MTENAPRVEEVIPVVEEAITVSKREVETGHVRVTLTTDTETVIAREILRGRKVDVERVPINRTLPDGQAPLQSREEGDTLVIPIVEEVAVVVKRLVLREELRLRFTTTETPFEEAVLVRRQKATVDRTGPGEQPTKTRRDTA
jgi:stress response protein YsnF